MTHAPVIAVSFADDRHADNAMTALEQLDVGGEIAAAAIAG